jgi:transcriptional regulator of acetoin/glycerol metabolism
MSWICSCGTVNSGIQINCAALRASRFGEVHNQISANKPDYLMAVMAAKEIMTPQEELFAKFYNHEKILVKDMNDSQLREHREELSRIAFEAKARLVAADDETRERKAKNGNKEWTVTPTESDQTTTDAINAVKTRKERMTKLDKQREYLEKAGLDENIINEMMKNMERRATEKSLKTVTFTKKSEETSAIQVKIEKPDEPKEPFDASKLKFGS